MRRHHHHHHHHHHRHLHGHRGRTRFWAPLHRRIFGWFGLAILATSAATFAAVAALRPSTEDTWRGWVQRGQAFASDRLQRVWDDPVARAELANAAAQQLQVGLSLHDAHGARLSVHGPACEPSFHTPVLRDGVLLGELRACVPRPGHGGPLRGLLGVAVGLLTLWGATGLIARRLSRPLREVARVAKQLGEGNLKARAPVGRRADAEAVALGQAVNEMADRIERQLADQRELLAAVSHELRTPLGHMRLLIELARGSTTNPKALDEIDKEVVELDALVGQLLAKSKLEFHSLSLAVIDPVDAARRALERAGLSASLLQVEGTVSPVSADPTLIARALANLLDNARKHAGGARTLWVKSSPPDGVAFEVDDAGPGFAPGEERRAFDAFHGASQAPTRDPESLSLGLGLALVERIATAHRGEVWARNRPETGATVGFLIRSVG